jgi:hypothetical protein
LERFSQRDYVLMEGILYQGLQDENISRQTPILAPVLTYHQTTAPLRRGTYATLDSNLVSLHRKEEIITSKPL